jgi:glycosyltransferase involved in cell wall biosynthesis
MPGSIPGTKLPAITWPCIKKLSPQMTDSKPHWAFIHPFQLRLQRGIEVYLWNLSAALARKGVAVDILTWSGPLSIPAFVREAGVRLRTLPSVRYFERSWAVPFYISHLLTGAYDHVFIHFGGYGEGPALQWTRRLHSIPFSIVFHFPPSLVPHRYQEFARWNLQQDAENLIAVSQATAREVEQWCKRSCGVIGHGVDCDRFKPDPVLRDQTRKELGINPDAPVLVSVAALEERKGIQWLIYALPALLKSYPDIIYLVIGEGPYNNELKAQVFRLGLMGQVQFLGTQLDVRPFLCCSDLIVVLASGEASSISLLEGMACGLPSVTSKHPPFDELIESEWGIMLDEQNQEVLASTIQYLLQQPGLTCSLGQAARAWAMQNYNWDVVAGEYRKLIG